MRCNAALLATTLPEAATLTPTPSPRLTQVRSRAVSLATTLNRSVAAIYSSSYLVVAHALGDGGQPNPDPDPDLNPNLVVAHDLGDDGGTLLPPQLVHLHVLSASPSSSLQPHPNLTPNLSPGTLLALCLINLLVATLLWALLPETKGRSLEQMLQYFVKITGDTSGQMSDLTKPNALSGEAAAKPGPKRFAYGNSYGPPSGVR